MGGTHSRRDGVFGDDDGGISNPNDADDASRHALEDGAHDSAAAAAAAATAAAGTPPLDMFPSPMISTPRVVTLPDLDAREHEREVRNAEREREAERRRARSVELEGERDGRRRAVSLGNERDAPPRGTAGAYTDAVIVESPEEWMAIDGPSSGGGSSPDETTRLLLPNAEEVRMHPIGDTYNRQESTGSGGGSSPDNQEGRRRRRIVQIRSSSDLKRSAGHSSTASLSSFFSMGATSSATPSPTPSYVDAFANESNPPSMSVLYGLINAAIVLPVLISFGSIIYQDEAFRPYLPVLVKLTVISGVVHQVCFSTFSGLPFAVGQVQDAGLIFLSAMATNMVKRCHEGGHSDEEILATVTVGLGMFTAVLGIGLVVIGRCRLASYVQLLPTPVVGGYLAFIGFFCGQSGMGLMAGVNVSGVLEWGRLFVDGRARLVLPGLAGGLLIYVMVRSLKHFAVLPGCIVFLVALFYAVLAITDTTVEEARDDGWISDADAPPVWYRTWDYLRPSKVVWSTLPHQVLTVLSMTFVVALSSSLDVAAIELELGRPLDYNRELRTVGLSNAISGLTGGYTGSYIFSQSIFSLRAGIRSRLSGYVLALCELITVVLPFSILSYVPNFFFGSLLVMIALDLCYEWLWDVRSKVTSAEYGVALATFALIQAVGVEYGILLGIALHVILSKAGFEMSPPGGVDGGSSPKGSLSVKAGGEGVDSANPEPSTQRTMAPSESGGSLGVFVDYGGVSSSSCLEDSTAGNKRQEENDGGTTHVTLVV